MKKFFSIFLLASVAFLLQATVVDQSTALQLVKSLYGERADSVNYYVGSVEKYVNKYYSPVNTDEAASIDWLSGSDEKWHPLRQPESSRQPGKRDSGIAC